MADNYDDYSREQLLRLLRERDRRPRFGLVWERDEIAHDLSINNDFVALDWDAELSCGDGPQRNLIIEGDNFDALRTLRMTHAGRVKCIYIDPPYNTGNRDFIYNDRFVDKEDNYRHSKWLEFMYRRLELAKELLTEDGVIFVSIDDNEMLHLGLLMEQVFGEANFVACFLWRKVDSPNDNKVSITPDHEFVLCYGLTKDQARFIWRPRSSTHTVSVRTVRATATGYSRRTARIACGATAPRCSSQSSRLMAAKSCRFTTMAKRHAGQWAAMASRSIAQRKH
ncbi:MAG: site-specific DNA-methyltransferase [Sulfuritalea sp.]|nr:site-specific DNA-methyltransferase [Sulfuritalea sp.]